jgi:hypothetical protein
MNFAVTNADRRCSERCRLLLGAAKNHYLDFESEVANLSESIKRSPGRGSDNSTRVQSSRVNYP